MAEQVAIATQVFRIRRLGFRALGEALVLDGQ